MKPDKEEKGEYKPVTQLATTNVRPLNDLEEHMRVMAGMKSVNPDAEFAFGVMYTETVARGSSKLRAAWDTLVFSTIGKATAGFWPWDAVKLRDVTKFMHTDSSKTFTKDGNVDPAKIAEVTALADSDGNISEQTHSAYVAKYQAATNLGHTPTGTAANKKEWGGVWRGDQKFTQTNAAGNKVMSANNYARLFTDLAKLNEEVKAAVELERKEAAQDKPRSSCCPRFGRK